MNFKPLGSRVLVERVEEANKTAGGIIIPDNAKEKPIMGKVVAISKKVEEKASIAEGDTVVFSKYAGTEVNIGGKDLLVLNTSDILGTVK